MSFGLSDIPDDWEIELDAEFVRFLDTLNRPWKYDSNGNFNPKGRHGQRESAVFWEAGDYYGKRQRHLITPEYLRRHNFYVKLWGYHRYHDAHTSRYGFIKQVDRGNWILKSELAVLREAFVDPLIDSDVENLVTGIKRSGFNPHANVFHVKRLPIQVNRCWAWLFGFYFSSGCVYHRTRYYQNCCSGDEVYIVFKAHHLVMSFVLDLLKKIGYNDAVVTSAYSRSVFKDRGIGTTIRAVIRVGAPIYLIMTKMGLASNLLQQELSGGGSRSIEQTIPTWIKNDDDFMHDFIEGYLNSAKASVVLNDVKSSGDNRRPNCGIYIRNNGQSEYHVKRFLLDIKAWFDRKNVVGYFRKCGDYAIPNRVQYELSFHTRKAMHFFLANFMLARSDLRVKLLLRCEADVDRLLYEILSELRSPENVILGLIYEQPRKDFVEVQMQKVGVQQCLQSLMNRGLVVEKEGVFYFEPSSWCLRKIQQIKETRRQLRNEIDVASTRLLFQCPNCGATYSAAKECDVCGSLVQIVSRQQILRKLQAKLRRIEQALSSISKS